MTTPSFSAAAHDEMELRATLVKGCKILHRSGMDTMAGHLSVRLDTDRILIKPRPVSWDRLTPADLIIMDMDGKRIDGGKADRTAVLEWPLHTEVYRSRPDIGSVLHAHPRDSTLFGGLGLHMEPLTRETTLFTGRLPVHENEECILCMGNIVTTAAMGQDVAAALAHHDALLLRYHGVLVATASIGQTCAMAYDLELAAKTMLTAAAIHPQPIIDPVKASAMMTTGARFRTAAITLMKDERWTKLQDYYLHDHELDDRGPQTTKTEADQTQALQSFGIT